MSCELSMWYVQYVVGRVLIARGKNKTVLKNMEQKRVLILRIVRRPRESPVLISPVYYATRNTIMVSTTIDILKSPLIRHIQILHYVAVHCVNYKAHLQIHQNRFFSVFAGGSRTPEKSETNYQSQHSIQFTTAAVIN